MVAKGKFFKSMSCYSLIGLLLLTTLNNAEQQATTENDHDDDDDSLIPCQLPNPQFDCPSNSLCTRINATNPQDLKCICLEGYQLNPKWKGSDDIAAADDSNEGEENYCTPNNPASANGTEQGKIIVYVRSASDPQHLVFTIVIILLGVTIVTAVFYGLKVLRPIKRTKAAYKTLQNRRQNITPLQEMDELELNRRYEMQTF
ncbi:uncharacterized protein LOC106087513 [Stomoxys calcitrans]|uniref:uncharacterized protein LOC106087513 n=1 Tax=Stomoxys calcitrans TaxID=35570 RepID=UPI0027E32F9F|nr:uncharacterized protein LOC106087513 [Stomoxys calcitrans]